MPEKTEYGPIHSGMVTSPKGFFAGAVHAGIKEADEKRLDLGVLFSEADCAVAGVFTASKLKSAPVLVSRDRVTAGSGRAVVVNSGCANACTGDQGIADVKEMARLMSVPLGVPEESVFVASTGVIGVLLPMDKVRDGLARMALVKQGGHDLAHAMMTTDTFPKEYALRVKSHDAEYVVAGVAKGAGMIHPNMGTLLCFLATDASVELSFLKIALKRSVDMSFNMVTVDGDTSPSDTVLLLANGMAGNRAIAAGTVPGRAFQKALDRVCIELARSIAGDGEGAKRLIEVKVEGARSIKDARIGARTIAGSSLVKAAVYGADPNWGRVVAAMGRSGAGMMEQRIDAYLGDVCVMKSGVPQAFDVIAARKVLRAKEVGIRLNLNLGRGQATAWGCDLTPRYVTINSAYTT